MSKQLINCDWLQFYANHHGLTPSEADRGTNFKLVDLKHGTRVFKDVYQVFERAKCTKSHRDELLATIALHPSSSIMRPNLCIVKIENKVLYGEQRYNRIATMIAQLKLEYCGITRADICVDLHTFANNLHPLALLRGYRKNDYIKRGSRRYSQWLTAPYSPSQVQGVFTYDIRSEEHVTHCVSWGGAQSDVHVKLYNKTKEIKEESGKQYISSWWRRNGLDNSADVWRVEISIQRRSRYLRNVQDDVVLPVNLNMLLDNDFLIEVFTGLASRHFSFRVAEVGKPIRSAKELPLFEFAAACVYVPSSPEGKPLAGRTAKIAANFMERVVTTHEFDYLTSNFPYCREALETAHDILQQLYEGLSTLRLTDGNKPRPSRKELQEKLDWLLEWNIIPEHVDGVPLHKIDTWVDDMEARRLYLEDLCLRRHELECHMMLLSSAQLQS